MPSTFDETALGGVITSGSSLYAIASRRTASGGAVTGGSVRIILRTSKTGSGGTITGGSASVSIIRSNIVSGGVKTGGVAVRKMYTFNTASGGSVTGGASRSGVFIRGHGGAITGGLSLVVIGFIASGGMITGGSGAQTFFDYERGNGGVVVGGASINNQQRFYRYSSTGGIVVSGLADYGIPTRRYNATSGIQIGGTASQNLVFHLDFGFKWNINARIHNDTTFLWNTGLLINYWYRIIGKDKCNHDPCCQRYILNVHARSPSELCGKLVNRRYNFTIESAQRFIMPADNAEVKLQEADGQNFECNTWVPIDLCSIPLCEEFCVNYDLVEDMSFDIIFNQVNGDHNYEASDGVYITGSAITHYSRILPSYSYEADGGIIIEGESPTKSSGFNCVATGGIAMGGTPYLRSTSWHFIGGQWPNTSRVRTGEQTESLPELLTDQVWSLTDRVIKQDNLFSSSDISYGRTSQFLIVRGFDFDVPDDSTILHVYVTVGRKANQLSVRDLEVYILNGDEIISENKAKNVDWPYLIESQTTYDFTDDFDVSDINDYNIGFALRVKAFGVTPSTIASVDGVMVEVIYEDTSNQKVRISGTAGVVSSAYSWVGSGGIDVSGTTTVRQGFKYKPNGVGITVGGQYESGLVYEAVGGILVEGSADARPSFQEITASGGMKTGGEGIAKPYFELGYGSSMAGGTARNNLINKISGTGGCIVSGKGKSPSAGIFSVVAEGGITMGGDAGRKTQNWKYYPSGNIVFVLGGADYHSSNLGEYTESAEFDMTVDGILVEFDSDKDLHDAKGVVEMLSRCGCGDIPLTLNLEQLIAKDNNFAKFLVRNSLTISSRLTMQYNLPNDSWQTNLHYTGLSADTNTRESWNVVFDIQCTQTLGGIFIGRQIWKLGMEVVRKNLNTGNSFSTRVVVGVLPDQICAANELKFKVTLDTQTGMTEISPVATIYQSVLYDDIGMFKNQAWITSPNLIFTVSQSGLDVIQNRIDLTSDVLVS